MSNIESDWENVWRPRARLVYNHFDTLENEVALVRKHINDYDANVGYRRDPTLSASGRKDVEASRSNTVQRARTQLTDLIQWLESLRRAFEVLSEDARKARRHGLSYQDSTWWGQFQNIYATTSGANMLERIQRALDDLLPKIKNVMKPEIVPR